MVGEIALAVPSGSLAWWGERLDEHGISRATEEFRFGEPVMPFRDPHGLPLALVGIEEDREFAVWDASPVPSEHQIRGVHAVRMGEVVGRHEIHFSGPGETITITHAAQSREHRVREFVPASIPGFADRRRWD